MKEVLKKVGTLLIVAGFGVLATGCSSKTATTAVKAKTPVRIWRTVQGVDPLRDVIKQFVHDNPTIDVTYSKKRTANYEQNALKSMAARQGPDIWSISDDWIGDEEDTLLPLPAQFFWAKDAKTGQTPLQAAKTLFPPGILEQITSTDGKSILGLPSNVDALQLYYNPAVFKLATSDFRTSLGKNPKDDVYRPVEQLLSTPPVTWNDLIAQGKYLNKRGDNASIARSAIAIGTSTNIPNSQDILQLMMMQNGVRIVGTDRQRALFHETQVTPSGSKIRPGEKALEFFTSFAMPDKDNYSWNPTMPPALDAFAQGKVAMVIAFSDFGDQLKIKYPRFAFKNAAVPQISTTQDPVNLIRFSLEAVTQGTASPTSSFSFLKSYAGEKNSTSLANEAKLRSPFLSDITNVNQKSQFQTKQILTGKAVYKKYRTDFDETFQQMITDVVQNSIDPNTAIDSAAEHINGLLSVTPDDTTEPTPIPSSSPATP
jgi:ABC-type glycerol-3-phosphate transport system substrate-binding protein